MTRPLIARRRRRACRPGLNRSALRAGGLRHKCDRWGNDLTPRGEHRRSIWEGALLHENTGDEGHVATAPAKACSWGGFGLYQLMADVWESCAAWFALPRTTMAKLDPTGPADGST